MIRSRDKCIFRRGPPLKRLIVFDFDGVIADSEILADAFGPNVYSASLVARGKPHTDIFLHAARQCGVAPADAIVIEDSVNGIRAAVAAGMTAIGLLAASHIRPGHAERMRNAGAHHI